MFGFLVVTLCTKQPNGSNGEHVQKCLKQTCAINKRKN